MNLLLNSIDAVKYNKYKKDRFVSINVLDSPEPGKILFNYIDNAGGIILSSLKQPERLAVNTKTIDPDIVFIPGVTSRPYRGGYGLFLVKKIGEFRGQNTQLVLYTVPRILAKCSIA